MSGRFQPGNHKLIIASVDNKGNEMYYYGYGKMEHIGSHINPRHTSIEWVQGTVRRQAHYPSDADFGEANQIGSDQASIGNSAPRQLP